MAVYWRNLIQDYLSIDDFYKGYGYGCFYKSQGKYQNESLYKSIMELIVQANNESFREGKKL